MSGSIVMYLTAYYCMKRSTRTDTRRFWRSKAAFAAIEVYNDWGW